MSALYYLIIPFLIGIAIGMCFKAYMKKQKRLDKEIEDIFNKDRSL